MHEVYTFFFDNIKEVEPISIRLFLAYILFFIIIMDKNIFKKLEIRHHAGELLLLQNVECYVSIAYCRYEAIVHDDKELNITTHCILRKNKCSK